MILQEKIAELNDITYKIDMNNMDYLSHEIYEVIKRDGVIYLCGNGGSAATANMFDALILQMNAKLSKLQIDKKVNSYSLNASTVHLAKIINNQNYKDVFCEQLLYKGNEKDLLIAISGSGNSENVVEAIITASELKMETIGLTGMGGGKVAKLVNSGIVVDSYNMQQIENVHSIILHMILNEIEYNLIHNI